MEITTTPTCTPASDGDHEAFGGDSTCSAWIRQTAKDRPGKWHGRAVAQVAVGALDPAIPGSSLSQDPDRTGLLFAITKTKFRP